MSAILIAIFGYFLAALEAVISKYLLVGKIKSWKLYVFYIGLLSLVSLAFVPFGLHWYGWLVFVVSLLSGVALFVHLALLYQVLETKPASVVYVLSGAVSIIVVLLLSAGWLGEPFGWLKLVGILCLLLGGWLVAVNPDDLKRLPGAGFVIGAGAALGLSLVLLKYVYVEIENIAGESSFVSGYVYSRLGEALATFAMLAWPKFRRELFGLLRQRGKKEHTKHFFATTVAKTMAGVGTLLVYVAIYQGSVTVVNALVSAQYLFVFLLSLLLTLHSTHIFAEDLRKKNIALSLVGVALVILGIALVSGVELG